MKQNFWGGFEKSANKNLKEKILRSFISKAKDKRIIPPNIDELKKTIRGGAGISKSRFPKRSPGKLHRDVESWKSGRRGYHGKYIDERQQNKWDYPKPTSSDIDPRSDKLKDAVESNKRLLSYFSKEAEKSYSGSQGDSLTPAINQGKIDNEDTMQDRTMRDREKGPKSFQPGMGAHELPIQDEVIPLVMK